MRCHEEKEGLLSTPGFCVGLWSWSGCTVFLGVLYLLIKCAIGIAFLSHNGLQVDRLKPCTGYYKLLHGRLSGIKSLQLASNLFITNPQSEQIWAKYWSSMFALGHHFCVLLGLLTRPPAHHALSWEMLGSTWNSLNFYPQGIRSNLVNCNADTELQIPRMSKSMSYSFFYGSFTASY